MFEKILSLSGSAFRIVLSTFGFSLSSLFAFFVCFCHLLFFFFLSLFCLREKDHLVTGHTHTSLCTFWFYICSFLFRVPRFVLVPPFSPRVLLVLAVCPGCVFVPVRSWHSARAFKRARASDPPSWTLGGGVFGFSPSCVVFVFPCGVCGCTPVSRRTGGGRTDPGSLTHPSWE